MTFETIFLIVNGLAMAAWAVLFIAPFTKWAKYVRVTSGFSLLFSIIYAIVVISTFGSAEGGIGSLPEVMELFKDPRAVLAGWIHYLAFDLLIGTWISSDAKKNGIPHWMILPALFFSLMYGPIGWLIYNGIRATLVKSIWIDVRPDKV